MWCYSAKWEGGERVVRGWLVWQESAQRGRSEPARPPCLHRTYLKTSGKWHCCMLPFVGQHAKVSSVSAGAIRAQHKAGGVEPSRNRQKCTKPFSEATDSKDWDSRSEAEDGWPTRFTFPSSCQHLLPHGLLARLNSSQLALLFIVNSSPPESHLVDTTSLSPFLPALWQPLNSPVDSLSNKDKQARESWNTQETFSAILYHTYVSVLHNSSKWSRRRNFTTCSG